MTPVYPESTANQPAGHEEWQTGSARGCHYYVQQPDAPTKRSVKTAQPNRTLVALPPATRKDRKTKEQLRKTQDNYRRKPRKLRGHDIGSQTEGYSTVCWPRTPYRIAVG